MIVPFSELQTWLDPAEELEQPQLDRLALLHPLVEAQIARYLGSPVEQAAYTHLLPFGELPASHVLRLPHRPVREIVSVFVDPTARAGQADAPFPAETQLTEGTEFYLDVQQTGFSRSGHLIRTAGVWPTRPRTVQVTYTAGWTLEELAGESEPNASDLKLAVLLAVMHHWQTAPAAATAPIQQERLGDYQVRYAPRPLNLPAECCRLLRPFRQHEYL